jgi:hypothetical protein
MRRRLTFSYVPLLIAALIAVGGIALLSTGAFSSAAAAASGGSGGSTLNATMEGKSIGADPNGRGAVRLELHAAERKLCYAIDADNVGKGRVFIGEGAKGARGHSVLTLFAPSLKSRGLSGCLTNVARSLIADLSAHPGQFFVAVSDHEFPNAAIRGQLRHSTPGPPSSTYSATDCYIYVYDDTGEGYDFATGASTTPTPIDGTGVRYLAGEDHSAATCIVSKAYKLANGTVKVYAKDRLIGSNVYSCVTTGVYKCFGPREGSTTSGWTLRVVYYVCIPGASKRPDYCPR